MPTASSVITATTVSKYPTLAMVRFPVFAYKSEVDLAIL